MGELFEVGTNTINYHLKEIFKTGEADENSVIRKFRITAKDGKNYLQKDELEALGRIVNAFLDLAENRAKRQIPMTMQDWAKRIDHFLEFDDREILKDSGKISAKIAKEKAETEFEKYRIIQDRLFESDFDKMIKNLSSNNSEKDIEE